MAAASDVIAENGGKNAPQKTAALPRRGSLGLALRNFLRVMRANPLTLAGFLLVLVISVAAVVVVVLPPLTQLVLGHSVSIVPYGPNAITPDPHVPPSWLHLFGTDNIGRDMFSRVLIALPLDLVIGFVITGFSLLVGGGLGLVAGYWDTPGKIGGAISVIILRVTDVFLAFPSLVLALAIAASLGRGTGSAILAIMLAWWPYYVRLARGEVLAVKHLPYVTAARAAGVSDLRILTRHVLRNILEPLTVYFTMDVGNVIVTFSTISFIGIGVPAEIPELGSMVEQYEKLLLTYPWTIIAPGLAIFIIVLAFSLLGDGLRDILDPRSRRALTQAAAPTTIPAPSASSEA
jgi:peptide/nickel transport system permease protein